MDFCREGGTRDRWGNSQGPCCAAGAGWGGGPVSRPNRGCPSVSSVVWPGHLSSQPNTRETKDGKLESLCRKGHLVGPWEQREGPDSEPHLRCMGKWRVLKVAVFWGGQVKLLLVSLNYPDFDRCRLGGGLETSRSSALGRQSDVGTVLPRNFACHAVTRGAEMWPTAQVLPSIPCPFCSRVLISPVSKFRDLQLLRSPRP